LLSAFDVLACADKLLDNAFKQCGACMRMRRQIA